MNLRQAHKFARAHSSGGGNRFAIEGIDRGNPDNVITVIRTPGGWQVGFEERGIFKPSGEYETQEQTAEAFLDQLSQNGRLPPDWRSLL